MSNICPTDEKNQFIHLIYCGPVGLFPFSNYSQHFCSVTTIATNMLSMFESFSEEYTYGVVGTAGVSGMYTFTFKRYC